MCILLLFVSVVVVVFVVKQKTAYEMRISDWSSDVCSSDLIAEPRRAIALSVALLAAALSMLSLIGATRAQAEGPREFLGLPPAQIGRASCRARVCQYV